jgi:hypothetical protein
MKTLFYSFLMFIGLSASAIAQEEAGTAVASSKKELMTGKESGKYTFILPETVSAEQVAQTSKYYTHYFTVNYTADERKAILKMVNNDEQSRHVVIRFLIANNIQHVNVEGVLVPTQELFEKYMK